MRKIWNWTKDNAGPITVTIAILGGFAAIIQFSVVRPMHQGFDAVNRRIDDQITYIHQHFDDQNISINQRFDDQNRSINQRFDAVHQRFNDQNRSTSVSTTKTSTSTSASTPSASTPGRIEDLVKDFSELRKLSDRVTRNETRIDTLTEQLQTADAPSPPD